MNIPYDIRQKQIDAENIIKKNFYVVDFYDTYTRKTLRELLLSLAPHMLINNPYAFQGISKRRMIKHIKCYITLHQLKCAVKPYII